VPIVSTTPAPSAITWVQVTCSPTTVNPPLSVGSEIDRVAPLVGGHSSSMAPNKIRVRPSVATARTSGSRPASAGPKIVP
jgi:hypothetical protein